VRNVRRSPLTACAVASVAVIGLGACTSQPSEKAVVKDVIEGLAGLSETERTCMLDKVDTYSEDELKAIGEENEAIDFNDPDAVDQGTEAFQNYVADLNSCMDAG